MISILEKINHQYGLMIDPPRLLLLHLSCKQWESLQEKCVFVFTS